MLTFGLPMAETTYMVSRLEETGETVVELVVVVHTRKQVEYSAWRGRWGI